MDKYITDEHKMTFERFIEILECAGFEPRSYSGRGMYGKECVAIRCDYIEDAILDISEAAGEYAGAFKRSRTDALGRSSVLYWPHMEWKEQ